MKALKDSRMKARSILICLSFCLGNIIITQAAVPDITNVTPENTHQVILATLKIVEQSLAQQTSLYALWSKNLQTFKQDLSETEQERDDIFDNIREIISDVSWHHHTYPSKTVLLRPTIDGILNDFQKESDAKIDYLMNLVTYLTKELEQMYAKHHVSTQQEKSRYEALMEHLVAVYVQHDHMLHAQTQFTKNLQEFADFLYTYMEIACQETIDLERFFFDAQESCSRYPLCSPCIQEPSDFITDDFEGL